MRNIKKITLRTRSSLEGPELQYNNVNTEPYPKTSCACDLVTDISIYEKFICFEQKNGLIWP